MRRSRRERLTFKLQSPSWVEAKKIIDNFVYDEKFNYTVYFIRDGKRKEESFDFHHVIKNESVEAEDDISIETYTFVLYKYKPIIEKGISKAVLTLEIDEKIPVDELIIERIEKVEKPDWSKAPTFVTPVKF